ncbi:MAG TPA: FliH/SctL family protein [Pseudolabrys sp.]|nr:FliH/SctL family protein [Pseudolabrys sp.]
MSAPAKFLFDHDFATGAKKTVPVAEHEAQCAAREAEGYRRGMASAEAQARAAAEQRIAAALAVIGDGMDKLSRGLSQIETRLETEAVEVAVAVANKLAPELLAREPFAEIASLATECFRHLVATPHVVVRVNDALYETAKTKLEEIAAGRGFQGRLVVLADPACHVGDCRIEWADGGVNRDQDATQSAINEVVARYVAARTTK